MCVLFYDAKFISAKRKKSSVGALKLTKKKTVGLPKMFCLFKNIVSFAHQLQILREKLKIKTTFFYN